MQGNTGETAQIVSALSHHFRKLDGVSVTDTEPALRIQCLVRQQPVVPAKCNLDIYLRLRLSASTVVSFAQWVVADSTLDELAHEITLGVEGGVIESMRRAAQPSRSPERFAVRCSEYTCTKSGCAKIIAALI